MKSSYLHLAVSLLLLIGASHRTFAQHTTAADCKGALAKDYYSYAENKQLLVDWLRTVDEQTYEAAKKDNSFSVLGLFTGGAFSMSDDYHQFDEKRRHYFEQEHYNRSEADAKHILSITTSDRAYSAYEACLRSVGSGAGVLVWASRATMDKIDLIVRYVNPAGHPSARLTGHVDGGKVSGVPAGLLWKNGTRWGTNTEKSVTIVPYRGESSTTVHVQDDLGNPVVEVTFQRADGEISLEYIGNNPILRTQDFRIMGPQSPSNHENKSDRCPNSRGRHDSYCQSETMVSYSTTAPRYLTNARGDCSSQACPWSGTWQQPTISADKLSASYSRVNWGREITPVLIVDIWENVGAAQCGSKTTLPAIEGQPVLFTVTKDCIPIATVKWKALDNNGSGAVHFGESSPSGQMGVVAGAPIASGDTTVVSYVLRKRTGRSSNSLTQ